MTNEQIIKEFEEQLNDLYANAVLFPKTKGKYDNTLNVVKMAGFKVMRNSKGIHKVVKKND